MTETDRPAGIPGAADAPGNDGGDVGDLSPRGLAIDDLISQTDWSGHTESLARWRQGHLVAQVPVTWLAPPGMDPITGEDLQAADLAPLYDPTGVPGVICTQTCDLGATPPGDRHPFIHVAPLVRGEQLSKSRLKLAQQGKAPDLIPVMSPHPVDGPDHVAVDAGSDWYADLRLQMPVSKACLLDRNPIEGFASEEEYQAFAERLAHKARRPALHAALAEDLPRSLTKFIRDNGATKQCFAKVEQVRLLVLEGGRLNPSRATLYVLTDGLPLADDEREVWARFQALLSTQLKDRGITVAPMIHCDVSELPAAKYRIAVPIPCEALNPLRFP